MKVALSNQPKVLMAVISTNNAGLFIRDTSGKTIYIDNNSIGHVHPETLTEVSKETGRQCIYKGDSVIITF